MVSHNTVTSDIRCTKLHEGEGSFLESYRHRTEN